MVFVFRADGGEQLGFGHLARCSALAEGLRAQGRNCLFVTAADAAGLAFLQGSGFDAVSIRAADETSDARATSSAIGSRDAVVVLDHYALGAEWQKAARAAGRALLCLSDVPGARMDCDWLLNQNWIGDPTPYRRLVPDSCELLLGPEFALLRGEFRERRRVDARRRTGRVENIFVSFGASDPTAETEKCIRGFLAVAPSGVTLHVLPGLANPRAGRIRAEFAGGSGVNVLESVASMAEFLGAMDLAIGAAGSTSWERCCLGVPSVLVQTADNQAVVADGARRTGFAEVLGAAGDVDTDTWARFFRDRLGDVEAWRRASEIGRRLVDGNGVERVISRICSGV